MSTPVSTISGWPASTSSRAWSRATFGSRLRLRPRANGTMQKAHRCWQPSWILRNARDRPVTRASGDRARVHHDHIGRLAEGHRAEAARLEHGLELLAVRLVEPAPERSERARARAHADTGSLSWPHAAPMSSPLLHRTVVVSPASSRIDWNARIRGSAGRRNGAPSQSLKGIRLTFARTPRRSRTRRRASSGESLTASSRTYSKKTRWRGASGYFLTAAMSVSTFHERLTGMSCDLTSSDPAWSEMARFTLRFSRPSFSIPGTSPTVETVIRRGE